jgi:hypothetical protein
MPRSFFFDSQNCSPKRSARLYLKPNRAKVSYMRPCGTSCWLLGAMVLSCSATAECSDFARAYIWTADTAGSDCSTELQLKAAVSRQLHREVFEQLANADLIARIVFAQTAGGWSAEVHLTTTSGQDLGQRRISSHAAQCSALNDSLALVVALMVDLTRSEVAARAAAFSPAPAADVHGRTSQSQRAENQSNNRRAVVTLRGILEDGQLPRLGWGGSLSTEIMWSSRLSTELSVSALTAHALEDGVAAEARFSLYRMELGFCLAAADRTFGSLHICAGPEVGLMRALGSGYLANRTTASPLINPFVKAMSAWWLTSNLGLQFGLGMAVPLIRDRYYAVRADGSEALLFKPAIVVPFLHIGVALGLPR